MLLGSWPACDSIAASMRPAAELLQLIDRSTDWRPNGDGLLHLAMNF